MIRRSLHDWLVMTVVSAAGGVIFLLPFLQEVYYKPLTFALGIDNTEVGGLMSAFGVTAMLSYLPGGWLADRVSPRGLLTLSLISTGMLGFYFASFPSYLVCLAIHAYWGVSVTFLFWGAMIRVTRDWAPHDEQGRAFGILESGRGLAEVLGSMGVLAIFSVLGSGDFALSSVITTISGLTVALGVAAWFVIDERAGTRRPVDERAPIGLDDVLQVLRMPVVWLIAIVVLSAYCAYWGTFRFTSYSSDIFGLSVTIAAVISVAKMWCKPAAALVAGFASDRLGIARSVAVLFLVLMASFATFAFLPGRAALIPLMLANVALASLAVFALRGIYFALLEEGGIPMAVTGTAGGIVSVIGFTPDIFMPLLGGMLIDRYPGASGYRAFFIVIAVICAVGLTSALAIGRLSKARKRS